MNLTIIIPYYNSIYQLKKLLMTIPKREDIEIIVINDKSTIDHDKYQELKKAEGFENIVFLENVTYKKGAGVCRNIGLRQAKGEWVLFADSDDYFVENMYSYAKKYFDSSADVVFFKPFSIYLDTEKEAYRHKRYARRIENYSQDKNIKNELELRYRFEVPWSKMIKRKLIAENKISFEEVLVSNDVVFSAKIGTHMNSFDVSNDIIYVVTKGSESLTTDMSEAIFDIRFKEKEKYYDYLQNHLSSKELDILNISFLDVLLKSRRYGVKKFFLLLKELIQHKLPILDKRVFNPIFLVRTVRKKIRV